jgi:murein DD-endopeptidase MepM/ murein hydrolase activator NlpD
MRVNGITDPTRLRVGQRLTIPGYNGVSIGEPGLSELLLSSNPTAGHGTAPSTSVTANSGEFRYQAVRGDTFFGIARRFGVTVNEIQTANSLSANHVLLEGQWLIIPVNQVSPGTPTAVVSVPQVTPAPAPSPAPAPAAASAARIDGRASGSIALDSSVRWPINARELNSMTGSSNGIIITGYRAESVRSLTAGTVIFAGPHRGYGRVVIIESANGYRYVYGGCESLIVREGDRVGSGMELGRLGIDPITQRAQLFFWVYYHNNPVDPIRAPRA